MSHDDHLTESQKRKRKRNAKKAIIQTAPQEELPLGADSQHFVASVESEHSCSIESNRLESDCRHDGTHNDEALAECADSSRLDDGCNGIDVRSMRSDSDTGCDTDDFGLEPGHSGGQVLDNLETVGTPCEHQPGSGELLVRHDCETEVQEGRGVELLHQLGFNEFESCGMDRAWKSLVSGMTTEQCIHAMQLQARYMDVCIALSDYPNATILEIKECIHAFDDCFSYILTNCYERLDSFVKHGG